MKTNKETIRSAMDRRLSFLDDLPSCRAGVLEQIAREEVPVMKKKASVGLIFALVLVLLSVAALAAGILLSRGADAARVADRALEEKYGPTDDRVALIRIEMVALRQAVQMDSGRLHEVRSQRGEERKQV